MKLLRPSSFPPGTDLPVLAARFTRESRLTAHLEHRGVPAVFDAGTDSGDLYLVMQLIAGHNLADVIAERSPLPMPWAVAIAAQITASPRSDLYALGCVLHEALCGSPVLSADLPLALLQKHLEDPPRPLRELWADVPEPIERLVLAGRDARRAWRRQVACQQARGHEG
ncbi:MAG: hypothetical protein ACRDT0_07865 [Pseudonocardiaceae bacterium]